MSEIYDDTWERFLLVCKPEQSGKTFVMIQNIIKGLKEPVSGVKTINIIFCDNNLLLTKQTSERVKKDLAEFEVNGELYLEFSSHKRTRYHCVESVLGAITYHEISNILCCTNGTRTCDVWELITAINRRSQEEFNFKIWLDEADKFIGHIDQTFKPLIDDYENIEVFCITATPKKLFYKYKYMNVLPIENTTSPEYHGWKDNDIRLLDMRDVDVVGFSSHVLNIFGERYALPGTKWFIPGKTTKKSHENIKEICLEKGFAVFVVNGNGIMLTLPDRSFYRESKDDELNLKLIKMYEEHNLSDYPIALTGNICVGRGISIMRKDFMIDYAILSSVTNKQETSQISGRVKGNIKHWDNYKKPIVFTTPEFDSIATEWETKSRGLAKLAFKKEQEGELTIIDKSEFKTIGKKFKYIVHPTLFNTFSEAKKFLRTKKHVMKTQCSISNSSAIHRRLSTPGVEERYGYAITSKLGKKDEITQENRVILEMVTNPSANGYIGPGTCISSTEKGSRYLILPVYETMETRPTDEKYQVRYIDFT